MEDLNEKLIQAIILNDIELVEQLIKAGADVNKKDYREGFCGETPLHWACKAHYEYTNDVVKLLIKAGADVNKVNDNKETPLHLVTRHGHFNMVKILIGANADVNKADNNGWTPLHWSCWYGLIKIAETLIDNGADVNIKSSSSLTPFNIAWDYCGIEIITKILISVGVDINKIEVCGWSPLPPPTDREFIIPLIKTYFNKNNLK